MQVLVDDVVYQYRNGAKSAYFVYGSSERMTKLVQRVAEALDFRWSRSIDCAWARILLLKVSNTNDILRADTLLSTTKRRLFNNGMTAPPQRILFLASDESPEEFDKDRNNMYRKCIYEHIYLNYKVIEIDNELYN